MKDLLIGIDAGTSVIKSVAFDLSGRQLAMASVTNSFVTLEGGGAEQDLDQTWRDYDSVGIRCVTLYDVALTQPLGVTLLTVPA